MGSATKWVIVALSRYSSAVGNTTLPRAMILLWQRAQWCLLLCGTKWREQQQLHHIQQEEMRDNVGSGQSVSMWSRCHHFPAMTCAFQCCPEHHISGLSSCTTYPSLYNSSSVMFKNGSVRFAALRREGEWVGLAGLFSHGDSTDLTGQMAHFQAVTALWLCEV